MLALYNTTDINIQNACIYAVSQNTGKPQINELFVCLNIMLSVVYLFIYLLFHQSRYIQSHLTNRLFIKDFY